MEAANNRVYEPNAAYLSEHPWLAFHSRCGGLCVVCILFAAPPFPRLLCSSYWTALHKPTEALMIHATSEGHVDATARYVRCLHLRFWSATIQTKLRGPHKTHFHFMPQLRPPRRRARKPAAAQPGAPNVPIPVLPPHKSSDDDNDDNADTTTDGDDTAIDLSQASQSLTDSDDTAIDLSQASQASQVTDTILGAAVRKTVASLAPLKDNYDRDSYHKILGASIESVLQNHSVWFPQSS